MAGRANASVAISMVIGASKNAVAWLPRLFPDNHFLIGVDAMTAKRFFGEIANLYVDGPRLR
jgi:hypothetical protein